MVNFWRRNKIFGGIIIGAVIIGGFIYFGLQNGIMSDLILTSERNIKTAENGSPQNLCGADSNTIVTKVIDGDTIVVEGGYHVRLLSIDADEKGYPCYAQAKTRLEELTLGKQIRLEKDKTDLDQYGRCLRYVFLGDTNIDVQLAREGLAVARFYAPDVKYKTEIIEAEKQAQTGGIGCKWAAYKQ